MARKRKYQKRKSRQTKKNAEYELIIIGLIILSLLLTVLIYGKSGMLGYKLSQVMRWYVWCK